MPKLSQSAMERCLKKYPRTGSWRQKLGDLVLVGDGAAADAHAEGVRFGALAPAVFSEFERDLKSMRD